jgi:isochorismate synthase
LVVILKSKTENFTLKTKETIAPNEELNLFDKTTIFRSVLQSAAILQLPVALWRLPLQTENGNCHLAVDFSGKANLVEADLDSLPAGFVVSPFVQENEKVHFIKADFHYQTQVNESFANCFANCFDSVKDNFDVKEKFVAQLQNFLSSQQQPYKSQQQFDTSQQIEVSKEIYQKIVATGVAEMQEGKFQKVALSRTKYISLQENTDLALVFSNLCQLYPNAFVALISSHEFGTWLVASPELLISVDKNNIFRTIALAGTQPKGDLTNLQEAMWRQKEIEEQALVSRYIINCFKKIRLREYEEQGPKTVVAGNLMHLRTDFEVDTETVNFPQLGTVMLKLLHPTSAVCGMPKPAAIDFIRTHEPHHRKLYTGYLGHININQETHIFVNLRCMEVFADRAVLYAGAGITKDSMPEREWNETELKCKTIEKGLDFS